MKKINIVWLGLVVFLLIGFNANSQNKIDNQDSKKEIWIKENSEIYKKQGGVIKNDPVRLNKDKDLVKDDFIIHRNLDNKIIRVENFNDLGAIKVQNTQEYRDVKQELINNSAEYYELNYSDSKKLSIEERNQLYNNPKY